MNIGLFGGTFNPPHLGHTELALDFYKASGVDLLIVMPSCIPPHKTGVTVSTEHRYEMTKLAMLPLAQQGVNYTVSRYEIDKQDTSYTVDTVRHLLKVYQVPKLSLCVGSDMFLSFEKWKCASELLASCHLYTKARLNGEYAALTAYANQLKNTYNATVTVMTSEALVASSTKLRADASSRLQLACPEVQAYIRAHHLYESL